MENTKGERREKIKRNQSKMGVTGAGVKNLWRIMMEKAQAARDQKKL
jgi:hypothetical protein